MAERGPGTHKERGGFSEAQLASFSQRLRNFDASLASEYKPGISRAKHSEITYEDVTAQTAADSNQVGSEEQKFAIEILRENDLERESIGPEVFGALNQVSGEYAGNIDALGNDLEQIHGRLLDKSTSPLFNEQGERIKLVDLNRLTSEVLLQSGLSRLQVTHINVNHIQPSAENIRTVSKLEGSTEIDIDEDNPFAALAELQVTEGAQETKERSLHMAWAGHIHLLHNILTDPNKFGISDQDIETQQDFTLEDLEQALASKPLHEAFKRPNGGRISVNHKKSLSRNLIEKAVSVDPQADATMVQLMMNHLVYKLTGQMQRTEQDQALKLIEREEELDILDAQLAKLLLDINDPGEQGVREPGYMRYAKLVWKGQVSPENYYDDPRLWLRLPPGLKWTTKKLSEQNKPLEVTRARVKYFNELAASEQYAERMRETIEMYMSGEIASTDGATGLDFDELGHKPFALIGAEVMQALHEQCGYNENEGLQVLAQPYAENFLRELATLRHEENSVKKEHPDPKSPHRRALERRFNNACFEFLQRIRTLLHDQDGTQRFLLQGVDPNRALEFMEGNFDKE